MKCSSEILLIKSVHSFWCWYGGGCDMNAYTPSSIFALLWSNNIHTWKKWMRTQVGSKRKPINKYTRDGICEIMRYDMMRLQKKKNISACKRLNSEFPTQKMLHAQHNMMLVLQVVVWCDVILQLRPPSFRWRNLLKVLQCFLKQFFTWSFRLVTTPVSSHKKYLWGLCVDYWLPASFMYR